MIIILSIIIGFLLQWRLLVDRDDHHARSGPCPASPNAGDTRSPGTVPIRPFYSGSAYVRPAMEIGELVKLKESSPAVYKTYRSVDGGEYDSEKNLATRNVDTKVYYVESSGPLSLSEFSKKNDFPSVLKVNEGQAGLSHSFSFGSDQGLIRMGPVTIPLGVDRMFVALEKKLVEVATCKDLASKRTYTVPLKSSGIEVVPLHSAEWQGKGKKLTLLNFWKCRSLPKVVRAMKDFETRGGGTVRSGTLLFPQEVKKKRKNGLKERTLVVKVEDGSTVELARDSCGTFSIDSSDIRISLLLAAQCCKLPFACTMRPCNDETFLPYRVNVERVEKSEVISGIMKVTEGPIQDDIYNCEHVYEVPVNLDLKVTLMKQKVERTAINIKPVTSGSMPPHDESASCYIEMIKGTALVSSGESNVNTVNPKVPGSLDSCKQLDMPNDQHNQENHPQYSEEQKPFIPSPVFDTAIFDPPTAEMMTEIYCDEELNVDCDEYISMDEEDHVYSSVDEEEHPYSFVEDSKQFIVSEGGNKGNPVNREEHQFVSLAKEEDSFDSFDAYEHAYNLIDEEEHLYSSIEEEPEYEYSNVEGVDSSELNNEYTYISGESDREFSDDDYDTVRVRTGSYVHGGKSDEEVDDHATATTAQLRSLDVTGVLHLLDAMNLGIYKESFKAAMIDGNIFSRLTDDRLSQLGVKISLHRLRLLHVIKGVKTVESVFSTLQSTSGEQNCPQEVEVANDAHVSKTTERTPSQQATDGGECDRKECQHQTDTQSEPLHEVDTAMKPPGGCVKAYDAAHSIRPLMGEDLVSGGIASMREVTDRQGAQCVSNSETYDIQRNVHWKTSPRSNVHSTSTVAKFGWHINSSDPEIRKTLGPSGGDRTSTVNCLISKFEVARVRCSHPLDKDPREKNEH